MARTVQEEFWQGEFGNDYAERNKSKALLASNVSFFSKIFARTGKVKSVIEFGCNVGINLKAIDILQPNVKLAGIEINNEAVAELQAWQREVEIIEGSILEIEPPRKYDMALIKGVLIHINPEYLQNVYQKLYDASDDYICVAEYYNPTPETVSYRGHEDRLFKRDFAGEILEKYPDLKLIDYGFLYHLDPVFPQDDITWFLLQKTK